MLVLLDRDGVINEDLPKGVCHLDEWRILPGAAEAIAQLTSHHVKVAVVTNQSAIGKGWLQEAELEAIHARLRQQVEAAGGKIDAIYYAPDHPDQPTERRKPGAGMLQEAIRDFGVKPADTPLVGDSLRDLQAAARLGCPRYLVKTGKGQATAAAGVPADVQPVQQCADLTEAVRLILQDFVGIA